MKKWEQMGREGGREKEEEEGIIGMRTRKLYLET